MNPSRTIVVSLAAALLAAAPAAAGDKEDALDMAKRNMGAAYSARHASDSRYISDLRKYSAACLKEIDRALAAGATLDDEIEMPERQIPGVQGERHFRADNGHWYDVAPLREAQELCRELAAIPDLATLAGALYQMSFPLARGRQLLAESQDKGKLVDGTVVEAELMELNAPKCREAIATARAAGIADDAVVEIGGAFGEMTLAAAEADFCGGMEQTAQAIHARAAAELEAMIAPYREALGGERFDVFVDRTWKKDALGSVKERNGCCDWPGSKHFR